MTVYHQAVTDPAAAVPIEARLPASRRTQQEPTMAKSTVTFRVDAQPLIDNLRLLAAALADMADSITVGLDELEADLEWEAEGLDDEDDENGPADT